MVIAIDYDGTLVSQERSYDDVTTPPMLMPGAQEALAWLKKAGHLLLLYSARASLSLRQDPMLDPLIHAGVRAVNMKAWKRAQPINIARYHQMLKHVSEELPGVFDAIDDGRGGKPAGVDMFIDDRAFRYGNGQFALGWQSIGRMFGEPCYSYAETVDAEYADVDGRKGVLGESKKAG